MEYEIRITPTAFRMLKEIADSRVRKKIAERIDELANEPDKQGKALTGELFGYRSVRTVGQRFRIIFRIEAGEVVVAVVAIGLRKEGDRRDIYELAQKLMRVGLLG